MIERRCLHCEQKFFLKYPSDILNGKGKYCSRHCRAKALYKPTFTNRGLRFPNRIMPPGYVVWNKGKKTGFVPKTAFKKGNMPANYKGGYWHDGYFMVYIKKGKYKKRARMVMEKKLGRKLKRTELVHHINGIKHDDRLENLMMTSRSEHINLHKDLS